MGCDIHGFLEIESESTPGEFSHLGHGYWIPRTSGINAALGAFPERFTSLYPPRGIPPGLSIAGITQLFRRIVKHCEALDHRGENFVLPWEVGKAEVLQLADQPNAYGKEGYILLEDLYQLTWLTLPEIEQSLTHAGLKISTLSPEFQFHLATMRSAESFLGRKTRFVFWFSW